NRDDPSPRGVQGRGVHGLAFAEEQQQALLRQVGRDVAIDATVTVALAEGEEVVEVNEREPGAMNQPAHLRERQLREAHRRIHQDRKSTRLNSSHVAISYAVFCLKKKIRP